VRKVIPIAAGPSGAVQAGAPVVHVVQHTSAEYLGLIEDHLEGRGIRFRYCRPFTGSVPLPAANALGKGLVLLGGGPWGSAGTRDVPTLREEIELARAALARDHPLLGIGLGAQILAIAAGGSSRKTDLEFSVATAKRVKENALGGYLPAEFPVATYMRDWPLPPAHADSPWTKAVVPPCGGSPSARSVLPATRGSRWPWSRISSWNSRRRRRRSRPVSLACAPYSAASRTRWCA
jgi:GMP synthase-like glutamine amidotransferase